MPINGAVLGAAFIAGVQPPDPLGAAIWLALGGSWATWTVANVTALATGGDVPLLAAPPPTILGAGVLVPGPSPVLGLLLAATSGSIDAPGIAKWLDVAAHYTDILGTKAGVNPAMLIGYIGPLPPIGPVSGTGGISMSADFDFAGALKVTDAPGIVKWQAVGAALKTHLTTLGLVTPVMLNPAAGGPVTGTGTIS